MTTSLLDADQLESWPAGRKAIRTAEALENPAIDELPGASGLTADTWVFLAGPEHDMSAADQWGLGFGPNAIQLPRWSLFHRAAKDHFHSHSVFPHPHPSDGELRRWTASIVGATIAARLLEAVGSCTDFYQQYFAERPDLRGRVNL